MCWAKNGLSYRLIDDEHFRDIFRACIPRLGGRSITRRTLAAHMIQLKGRYENELKDRINGKAVTVACDGWKNRDDRIMNFAVLSQGIAYYVNSVLYERCDGDTVKAMLVDIAAGVRASGATLAAISADNFTGMNAGVEKFVKEPENACVLHVKCAAHSTQLFCKDVCSVPPVSLVMKVLDKYLAVFATAEGKEKLKRFQLADGRKTALKVVKPADTRWDSRVAALERMVELRKYIKMADHDIPEYTWSAVNFTVEILQEIRAKTNILQRDCATIRHAERARVQLHEFMQRKEAEYAGREQTNSQKVLSEFFRHCGQVVLERKEKHMSTTPLAKLAVLLLGCDGAAEAPSDASDLADSLKSAAAYYFSSWGSSSIEAEKKAEAAVCQFTGFIIGGGHWCKGEGEKWKPYWMRQSLKCRELSTVALAMGSIHPTESCVERTFSHQGLVHSDLRNRLEDESVKAIMAVRFNHDPLFKPDALADESPIDVSDDE